MRNIRLIEGEFYRLYNRGADKRKVFTTPQEYRRFLAYLYLMNEGEAMRIHLNPAKLKDAKWKERGARDLRGFGTYVREYPYSSLREYLNRNYRIINPAPFPEYFRTAREFDDHIDFWLKTKDQNFRDLNSAAHV